MATPGTVADTHPEIHQMLAQYHQQLADYHAAKAADPLATIPIPEKPKS